MKIRDDMVARGVWFMGLRAFSNSQDQMRALLDAAINGPHEHTWKQKAAVASGGGGGPGFVTTDAAFYSTAFRRTDRYECECGAGKTVEIYEPPR